PLPQIPLLLQDVHGDCGVKLDQHIVATPLDGHPLHRALHPPDYRFRSQHPTGSVARRAGLGRRLIVALPNALPRHFDQAEVAYGDRLGAGAMTREMLPQLLENAVAVRLRLHVDEVADDDAADVAPS